MFGGIFFWLSGLKIVFGRNEIEMLLIIFLSWYFKECGVIIVGVCGKER